MESACCIYLKLAKTARDIFSVQATSVSVERFFSQGSLIINKKKTSIKDNTFQALTFNLICLNLWSVHNLKDKILLIFLK